MVLQSATLSGSWLEDLGWTIEEYAVATTSPTRIDDELYASAKIVGELMSRSAAQQVSHWARIGRELEAAGQVSHRAIAEVLAGARDYDQLSDLEQAVVRSEWAERLQARREQLNLAEEFAARGRASAVELDDDGTVDTRQLDGADGEDG